MSTIAVPADIVELADWYASRSADFADEVRRMRAAERRLSDYVRDCGPIETPAGRLEIIPAGWDYSEAEIAAAFPSLLSGVQITFEFGDARKAERAQSLIEEELPGTVTRSIVHTIDKAGATRIEKAGGAAAERMRLMRRPKGRLGVKS